MGARMTCAFWNFNVEKGAEQEISKRKPSMVPKHPSTRSLLQEHLSQYPEIEEEVSIGDHFDENIMDIPKGKITVVEALTLLNNHTLSPETWTAEKIAQEHHRELKDANSLLKYFLTFEVKIVPSEDRKAIQSK